MELILWRHAEAEDGVPDSGRELTDKGLKQAKAMAEWLKPRLPKNTRVIVSPTRRTQQTAAALDDDFETVKEIGPGVSAKAILAAAGWPDAKGAVVVVGHQPTLGEVAALLMSGEPESWDMRKGAVWWFSHKTKKGVAETVLRTSISPDMLSS
ncbi:MAG: phosphohistidine phosphatase SixA [Nitrosospira sp.]|nr:phosphohistidine phosphatase SixA [Nitrosospira sp.]MDN5881850.1 phosphohistidine phosphatase SixA [Nitrosospira sp.]MDN5936068.1 phosphohistidine phosphatase SixA [Nitrosospira sp.]